MHFRTFHNYKDLFYIRSPGYGTLYPLLLFVVLALGICMCDIQVVSNNPHEIPFKTEHFHIYYDNAVFEPDEVERIGYKKEQILEHINSYLKTNYDGVIEVHINNNSDVSYACGALEYIHERYDYILDDSGHEIAHIVSIQEWGRPRCSFFVEGIAVAAEVYLDRFSSLDAIIRFQSRISFTKVKNIDKVIEDIKQDIVDNAFEYSGFEYQAAGAFFHYLNVRFGIDAVKKWYMASIHDGVSKHEESFKRIFNISLDDFLGDFKKVITPP